MGKIQVPLKGAEFSRLTAIFLNCVHNPPASHLTLSMWPTWVGWNVLMNSSKVSPSPRQSDTSTKQATRRKTRLNDGAAFFTFQLDFLLRVTQKAGGGLSGLAEQQLMLVLRCPVLRGGAGRKPSGESLGFFCLPVPAAVWHQPPDSARRNGRMLT